VTSTSALSRPALLALALLLVPTLVLGQTAVRDPRDRRDRRDWRGPAVPLVSLLAQTPGTWPVATGALTAPRGPSYTFTRTSTRTCTKADGTLVALSAGQPCVETTGLVVEWNGINLALNSEAFNLTSWLKTGTAAPTVAAIDSTDVPGIYGTDHGAEKVSFQAVTSGGSSVLVQILTVTTGTFTWSAWARVASGTATTYVFMHDGSNPVGTAKACNLTTTWQRCYMTGTLASGTFLAINIGTNRSGAFSAQQADTPAQTIYVQGADLKKEGVLSSYVPAGGTSATRTGEVVSFGSVSPGPSLSMAATATVYAWSFATGLDSTLVQLWDSGRSEDVRLMLRGADGKLSCGTPALSVTSGAAVTLGVPFRGSCRWDAAASRYRVGVNGVYTYSSTASAPGTTFGQFNVGSWKATNNNANLLGGINSACLNQAGGVPCQ
jgi:hypothetical protein